MNVFITREIPEIGIKYFSKKYDVKVYKSQLPVLFSQLAKNVRNG